MDIAHLIRHPEDLNAGTLHELRELVAEVPYFQVARMLYLKNLFLLHDPTFDKELRQAAFYLPNRRILFRMVHGRSYEVRVSDRQVVEVSDPELAAPAAPVPQSAAPAEPVVTKAAAPSGDRTASLIDGFLSGIAPEPARPNRSVKADPASDYMAYLFQSRRGAPSTPDALSATARGEGDGRTQSLIDSYIGNARERLVLNPNAQGPKLPAEEVAEQDSEGGGAFFTETLAKIYIQQGRYERAIEIITNLHANNPKKSAYFADQIRFLRILALNSKHKS